MLVDPAAASASPSGDRLSPKRLPRPRLRGSASLCLASATMFGLSVAPASAQEEAAPRRTRVVLGPQLVPSFPGSSDHRLQPLVDVARARGDAPFEFTAADESFGFPAFSQSGFSVGPSLSFEGSRPARDVGGELPRIGNTVEVGGFAQYQLRPDFRVRVEGRRGLGGHRGWVGAVSADYIARRADDYLVSLGPRVTFADGRHHRAFFGVAPQDAAPSGLPAFRPEGGVQAVGAATTVLRQLTRRWGIYGYARYDRLVRDAGRSPVVRAFGSRDQVSGGVALSYTFGGRDR